MQNRLLFSVVLLAFSIQIFSQNQLPIIPQPNRVELGNGVFVLKNDTRFYFPKGKTDWETACQALMSLIQPSTGWQLTAQPFVGAGNPERGNSIFFLPDATIKNDEGYRLDVTQAAVVIRARTAIGAFWAVQTLRQIMPQSVENQYVTPTETPLEIPACHIEDEPRFAWRGLHLDVCRHFFSVEFVKRFIDLLALHKMNTFHWHLTDDQGWRIEIKKYPLLTQVASKRKETLIGHFSDEPHRFDGKEYGGFYTQDEIKEVVAYAQKKFVTIVPEIEMPGHATAAISAYPELGCEAKKVEVATTWGVFEDVFCPGNEATFQFIDEVLEEVCALFPGKYVHVGGDECPKMRWKNCEKCQLRMKMQGCENEEQLQSYFMRRVEGLLEKRNKKLIGWDEILDGGIAPSATIMSWRGIEGGIAAAKAGHDAVMTPGSHCYFDKYQSAPEGEPTAIGGLLSLQKVYDYEPIPSGLTTEEAKHILGAQGNLWTEYISTNDYLEYMAFPRACALAEVVWSKKEGRSFDEFAIRLKKHFARLDALGVHYSRAYFDIVATTDRREVTFKTADAEAKIHWSPSSEPTAESPLFDKPIRLSKNSTLKAAAFIGDKKVGKTLTINYLINKATGKPYSLTTQPTNYTGNNPHALTDGIQGTLKTWNRWVGLSGNDLDPIIDLGQPTSISKITTHFLVAKASWIMPPTAVEVSVSDDGKTFRPFGKEEIQADKYEPSSVETVEIEEAATTARYLKILFKNYGKLPPSHPSAGEAAWLFVDEIIVD